MMIKKYHAATILQTPQTRKFAASGTEPSQRHQAEPGATGRFFGLIRLIRLIQLIRLIIDLIGPIGPIRPIRPRQKTANPSGPSAQYFYRAWT